MQKNYSERTELGTGGPPRVSPATLSSTLLLPALAWAMVLCLASQAGAGLRTEYIDVYNRPASVVADLARPLLSDQGTIIADDEVNLVVVVDHPENVLRIFDFITQMDKAQRSVTVQATLIRASDRTLRELGVDVWGGASASAMVAFGQGYVAAPQGVLMTDIVARLTLNDSTTGVASQSRAHITTMSGKTADLRLGVSVPYVVSQGWGSVHTEFRDVLLRLTVTPGVRPDGRIDLQVSIGDDALMPGGAIATTGATTRLLLSPGEVATIAGTDRTSSLADQSGTPGMQEIPILGILFGSRTQGEEQTRLVILVSADYR